MQAIFPKVRRASLVGIALCCFVAGAGLLWGGASRETAASLTTFDLLSLLGLFFLPAGAMWLILNERRVRKRAAATGRDAPARQPALVHAPDPRPRRAAPPRRTTQRSLEGVAPRERVS